MSEDWAAIAAEVADAIRSVGSTDDGYPAAIRREVVTGGSSFNPTTTPTYTTVHCIERNERVRSADGSYVDMSRRTLTVTAEPDFEPTKSDTVAVGITEEEADETSDWRVITEVRPLSPAGTAVLYELDLSA
ncbi:hypothetical protein [Marinobacter alexandrii]|uniref:hypothetical protein n=1 Tax=Marinobacter alexandrii TaxID=2570351 RepID=UPI001108C08C|nr:hypothetical protein [Marinobacter alexandrii]